MNNLIIYDSNFGNTKKIAGVIGKDLQAKVIPVTKFDPQVLENVKLLIVGSPINGWQPTQNIRNFLSTLGKRQLKGVKVTSFDTRVDVFFHGNAGQLILRKLIWAGGEKITDPEGFYVKTSQGPFFDDQIDRAHTWAESIKKSYGQS